MSVAKNIEITSLSKVSFEDAIEKGIARAAKTIDDVRGAWIKEQKINIQNGKVSEFQVMMIITFVLDGGDEDESGGGGKAVGSKSGGKGKSK